MSDRYALDGVETNTDDVVFDIHGNKLSVSYTVGEDGTTQISCKDSDGNELSQTIVDADNQVTTMDDSRFLECSCNRYLLEITYPEFVQRLMVCSGTS